MQIELQNASLSAQLRSASFRESDNSIEVIWTTGAAVRRRGPRGYFDEVLTVTKSSVRLDRLNAGAPFLDAHRDGSLEHVIGAVVSGSAKIVNGQGVARIALSRAAADADNISKIKDGIIRNISVGYQIHSVEIVEREGDVPIYRVTDWEPLEISAVPVPADAGSQVRNSGRGVKVTTAEATYLHYWSAAAARERCLARLRAIRAWPHPAQGH